MLMAAVCWFDWNINQSKYTTRSQYSGITDLTFGLPQFAFESGEDSLDLPQPLLFRQVFDPRLQVPVQAVQ